LTWCFFIIASSSSVPSLRLWAFILYPATTQTSSSPLYSLVICSNAIIQHSGPWSFLNYFMPMKLAFLCSLQCFPFWGVLTCNLCRPFWEASTQTEFILHHLHEVHKLNS
jgi:hypothetical protein